MFLCRACAYPRLIVRIPPLLGVAALSADRYCSDCPSAGNGWEDVDAGRGDFCGLAGALERLPRPPMAQLTSTPRLMLQSQTSAKTGVLTRTFRTGKMSGRRAGGVMRSSATWTVRHAA